MDDLIIFIIFTIIIFSIIVFIIIFSNIIICVVITFIIIIFILITFVIIILLWLLIIRTIHEVNLIWERRGKFTGKQEYLKRRILTKSSMILQCNGRSL